MVKNIVGLFASLALCFAASAIGVLLTRAGLVSWYPDLVKPSWNPPNGIFTVWTSLYTMMAVSAWLVWRRRAKASVTIPLSLFCVQLALNALWPFLFFALRSPGLGFVESLVLWGMIVATIVSFSNVNKAAGVLMVPYLLWVTFATMLNGAIWKLNPG